MNLRNNLSEIWFNIKNTLFPFLEDKIGELPADYKKLISILELVRIEEFIPCTRFNLGRVPRDRAAIARSFVAKIILKLPYTKQLVALLKRDEQLRLICGWEFASAIPSESKFSRVFKLFSECSLPEKVHQALIKKAYKNEIIGHLTFDSTPIASREQALKKTGSHKSRKQLMNKQRLEKIKKGEPNRRQKQLNEWSLHEMLDDLPKHCDIASKKGAQGYITAWKGYKLHVAVDDLCVPIAGVLTSASLNDSEAAIPLAVKSKQLVTNFYDLMDSAYDLAEIKEHSISAEHVPIIDKWSRSKAQKVTKEAEAKRKRLLNFQTAEDRRYKNRFSKERFNALYKDYCGGRTIFYRGIGKISCHVMFGLLVVAASTLLKSVE